MFSTVRRRGCSFYRFEYSGMWRSFFDVSRIIYVRNVGVIPPTKWCHVTEYLHLQKHRCENLKSHAFAFLPQIIKWSTWNVNNLPI